MKARGQLVEGFKELIQQKRQKLKLGAVLRSEQGNDSRVRSCGNDSVRRGRFLMKVGL